MRWFIATKLLLKLSATRGYARESCCGSNLRPLRSHLLVPLDLLAPFDLRFDLILKHAYGLAATRQSEFLVPPKPAYLDPRNPSSMCNLPGKFSQQKHENGCRGYRMNQDTRFVEHQDQGATHRVQASHARAKYGHAGFYF